MFNLIQTTKSIADYLPNGKAWVAKRIQSTNTYKLLKSFAQYVMIFFADIEKLKDEMSPDTTTDLIDRWEKEYGIPDDIIEVANNLPDRRKNVILKMAGLNISTLPEFQNLAIKLGYTTIVIATSSGVRFPPYSVPSYPLSLPGAYFVIIITADFSIVNLSYFAKFIEKLIPANVKLLLIDTSI